MEKRLGKIRNFNTLKIKEKIFLIMSGSKKIYGECVIKESIKVDKEVLLKNLDKHQISKNAIFSLSYKNPHAWVLSDVKKFSSPIPYNHKKGCVIWVNV